ncbi:MAG: L,D-transpeptidase [Acidimicrobiales bacterium]
MGTTARQARVRTGLSLVVLLQLVAGVIAVFTVSGPPAAAVAPPPPVITAPEPVPAPAPEPVPGETDAADAVVPKVNLFKEPGAASIGFLTNPTFENVPLILHVLEDKGEWLHVRVNTRPNGRTAWVRRSDVAIRRVPNRIVIEVGARKLTVLHGNDVLAQHPVAVGAPRTPTPIGDFYVDATVHLANAGGQYGVGQLSVSGFSEVLKSFAGGIGQIAIHGTGSPGSVGKAVSNGCIRMHNNAWTQVAALAPNGTPVSIRP